jgi:hypothetical protein
MALLYSSAVRLPARLVSRLPAATMLSKSVGRRPPGFKRVHDLGFPCCVVRAERPWYPPMSSVSGTELTEIFPQPGRWTPPVQVPTIRSDLAPPIRYRN